MSKTVILAHKLNMRQRDLEQVQAKLESVETDLKETLASVDSVENEEELEIVEKALESLESRQAEIQTKRDALQQEIDDLSKRIKAANDKKPKTDGGIEMNQEQEFRSGLNEFVRTKGQQTRESFKLVDSGALLLPEYLPAMELPREVTVLENLVNRISVNTVAGEFPVISHTDKKMNTVEELEKNPELATPKITKLAYKIATYRGYIPISQEAIDDTQYDLSSLIQSEIQSQALNTKNAAIATLLKEATPKQASGFDGLKDLINKEIKPYYAVKLIVTQSLFAALDKVKDKEGRYMLQTDVTSPTGYKFAGRPIYVLPDTILGESEGDMKAFVGDPKAYMTLFDRLQTSVKWVDNNIYGQLLACFIRFDVQKVDANAGFYVTYTDAA